MKSVVIHSDGACQGNPGPGGWAAILQFGPHVREVSGGALMTTNNRMELQGAISGLNTLIEPCEVNFYTDSNYVRDGISKWVKNWKRNGWKTMSKEPVKNEDLWRALDLAVSSHKVTWHWLKGHAGHPLNERCDLLARTEIAKLKPRPAPFPAVGGVPAPPRPDAGVTPPKTR